LETLQKHFEQIQEKDVRVVIFSMTLIKGQIENLLKEVVKYFPVEVGNPLP